MTSRIKTTGVGSYPVLPWMVGNPSRLVLRDAMMAGLKAQGLAGFDLVTGRGRMGFVPRPAETHGMVDYFIGRMDGIRKHFTVAERARHRFDRTSGHRLITAGVVVGKIGDGTLNLPDDSEFARALTTLPLKFTCTGPHMLARL